MQLGNGTHHCNPVWVTIARLHLKKKKKKEKKKKEKREERKKKEKM